MYIINYDIYYLISIIWFFSGGLGPCATFPDKNFDFVLLKRPPNSSHPPSYQPPVTKLHCSPWQKERRKTWPSPWSNPLLPMTAGVFKEVSSSQGPRRNSKTPRFFLENSPCCSRKNFTLQLFFFALEQKAIQLPFKKIGHFPMFSRWVNVYCWWKEIKNRNPPHVIHPKNKPEQPMNPNADR